MNGLTHIDEKNQPTMVDVSAKNTGERIAVAESRVLLGAKIISLIENKELNTKKGPVFQTAIIAGTMGAKKTADLIPFCHTIGLDSCKLTIDIEKDVAVVQCEVKVTAKTGVEMEAITGASIAAITIYDMCKALSHEIEITSTRLLKKTGGKRDFIRQN